MSCNKPLKAFPVGFTNSGKIDYKICSYDTNHVELHGMSWIPSKLPVALSSSGKNKILKNGVIEKGIVSEFIDIPCGKCAGCRLDHASRWVDRLLLESNEHEKSCFITLTYEDSYLPKSKVMDIDDITGEITYTRTGPFNSVDYRDVQLFIKRLRRHLEIPVKNELKRKYGYKRGDTELLKRIYKEARELTRIKFFAATEYGGESKRPHAHLLVFGYMPDDLQLHSKNELGDLIYTSEEVFNLWDEKGFVTVTDLTPETCAYVARYTLKKANENYETIYSDFGIDPEKLYMSNGIGRAYYERNKDNRLFVDETFHVSTSNGSHAFKRPKYFDKLYEVEHPEVLEALKEKNKKFADYRKILTKLATDKDYGQVLEDSDFVLNQKTKILKERSKI